MNEFDSILAQIQGDNPYEKLANSTQVVSPKVDTDREARKADLLKRIKAGRTDRKQQMLDKLKAGRENNRRALLVSANLKSKGIPQKSFLQKIDNGFKSTFNAVGGFLGTKALGEGLGNFIQEGGEIIKDIKQYSKDGTVRNREAKFGNDEFKKTVGGAISSAANFIGGAAIGSGAKALSQGGKFVKIAQGAKTGAVAGGLTGVGGSLENSNDLSQVAIDGTIGAGVGLGLGAAIPAAGNLIRNKGKVATLEIAEKISPKINKSRAQKLVGNELVEASGKGVRATTLGQKISITPEQRIISQAETIEKLTKIKKSDTVFDLVKKVNKANDEIAIKLQPELKKIKFSKTEIPSIKQKAQEVANKYLDDIEFGEYEKLTKKSTEKFNKFLDQVKEGGNLDDLWELRKTFDKTVKDTIKNYDPLKVSDPRKELLQGLWKDQRRVLNEALHDIAEKTDLSGETKIAFNDMRNLFQAKDGILSQVDAKTLKSKEGLLTVRNILAGGGGIGLLNYLYSKVK